MISDGNLPTPAHFILNQRRESGEFGCKKCKRFIDANDYVNFHIVYCDYGPLCPNKAHCVDLTMGCEDWEDKICQ